MATNLTPELMQRALQYYQQTGAVYRDPVTGQYIQPTFGASSGMGADFLGGPVMGYSSTGEVGDRVGADVQNYGAGGEFLNTSQTIDPNTNKEMLLALAAMGGMMMLPGGVFGGPALGGSGATGAAGGVAGGGAPAWTTAAMDSQLANAALGSDALSGYLAAGATPAAVSGIPAASAATGGGLLSGIKTVLGGASEALGGKGALTGLLGAALGSQEQKNERTTRQDIDPRMAEYLYGQGGLLPGIQSVYAQQMGQGGLNEMQRQGLDMQRNFLMSPQYAQGYQQMGGLANALLGAGVAGNPFKG